MEVVVKKPWYSLNKGTEQTSRKVFPEFKDLVNHEKKDGLHIACELGHNNIVRKLLDEGIEANSKTNTGKNALHLAVNRGQIDSVRDIINYYEKKVKENHENVKKSKKEKKKDNDEKSKSEPVAKQNFWSKNKETTAIKTKKKIYTEILNTKDQELNSPIMLAIRKTKSSQNPNAQIAIFEKLLQVTKTLDIEKRKKNKDPKTFMKKDSKTPEEKEQEISLFKFCAQYGSRKALEKLCNHKNFTVEIGKINKKLLNRVFHEVIRTENNLENVQYFLYEYYFDENKRKLDLNSAINLAAELGRVEVFEIEELKPSISIDPKLIVSAVKSGKSDMIENITNLTSDNFEDILLYKDDENDGNTPLHEASKTDFDTQQNADEKEKDGEPAKHDLGFKFLLDKYRDITINISSLRNTKKQSILHLASGNGSKFKVKELLEGEEDENNDLLLAEDEDTNRALHFAAQNNKHEVYSYLLSKSKESNDDPNPKNRFGKSPLHIIAEVGADKVS